MSGLRSYETYEVVTFQLTDRYVGAFWDGQALVTEPLEAIGVAKLNRYQYGIGEEIGEPDSEHVMVGLMRDKEYGSWDIVNEATNFVGIFKPSEDLSVVKVPDRIKKAMAVYES